MKSKIILTAIVLISVAAVLYINLNQPTGFVIQNEDYTVKVGYKANANYVPLFVALENGYFEEEGVKVETFRFDSTNTLMDSFAAGNLDATPTGNVIVSYSLDNSQSGLFKIFAFAFYTDDRHPENLIARKGSGIVKYQDIEGKNIGSNRGIFARTMLNKFLEKNGVKNFEIVELSSSLQLQALETGQIDALLSLEPFPTIGVEKGIGEYLEGGSVYAKTVGFTPSFSGAVISTRMLNEHPEETKRFLLAMERAFDFISENLDESKSILPKYVAIEEEIAEKITFPEYVYIGNIDEEDKLLIQKTADFLVEEGVLKETVDTANLLLDNKHFQ